MMPPRSSATASAARKTFSPTGTLVLKIASTPRENAISVAIGMARPLCICGLPPLRIAYISTGTIIPPHAPMIGRSAFFNDDNSPTRISRLISRPTERKKMAMRKSLITCMIVIGCPPWLKKLKLPIDKDISFCQNSLYHCAVAGQFAQISARTVHNMSMTLELTWLLILLMKL